MNLGVVHTTNIIPSLQSIPSLQRLRGSWIERLFQTMFDDTLKFLGTCTLGLFGVGHSSEFAYYSSETMYYLMILTLFGALSFFATGIVKGGLLYIFFNLIRFICHTSVALISCFYHITKDDYHFLIDYRLHPVRDRCFVFEVDVNYSSTSRCC